jgi:hypothetical protein
LPAILVGKASARQHHAPARQFIAPVPEDALDLGLHGRGAAEPEGVEMVQPEGKHVVRMFGENRLPDVEHALEVALAGQVGPSIPAGRHDPAGKGLLLTLVA